MYVKQSKVRGEQKLFALTRGCKLQTLRFGLVCLNTFYCLMTLPRAKVHYTCIVLSRTFSTYFFFFFFYKTRMRFEMNCRFFLIIREEDRSYNTERFFEIFRISRSF